MSDDYEVGYGKPPKEHQFKKGQSGNPSGRPKRQKSMEQVVHDELYRKVTVRDSSGRKRKMSVLAMAVRAHAVAASKGNARSLALLLSHLPQQLAEEGETGPIRITLFEEDKDVQERMAAIKAAQTPEEE